MKTSFSRRPKFKGGLAVGAIGFFVLLLLILRFVFPGALAALGDPLWRMGSAATATLAFPEGAAAVMQERDTLRIENEVLLRENEMLAARLADVAPFDASGVLAGVLARPPLAPYDVLVVGAGTKEGVTEGSLVYAPGEIPIGTVGNISQSRSRVALYSASGRTTEGWVGEERIPITLEGQGGGLWSATVASDAGVVEGAVVYLPGPGAVPVGTVARVKTSASAPHATLSIRPSVNPFMLTWVRIADPL